MKLHEFPEEYNELCNNSPVQKYLTSRDALPNSPYAKIDRFYKNLSIFFSTYDKLDVNQNKI